jgi:GNAT superfamily N-acetyltransferase
MEAQQFNVHSMNLASGKETLLMDKDAINHEMTQVMSYVADPTLFIPFGGIAAKGARLIGMGEGLAKASARAATIRNKVLGGAIKWGAGVPIEFLGTATRNTIDYGLERSASAFEFATGMPAAEAQATARQFGLNSVSASLAGETIPLPIVGNIAGAAVGATTARGVGEALTLLGEQISKQAPNGRGILSYAGQALRDSEKAGVQLSAHAKGLLKVIDLADPLFVYGSDLAEGAIHGSAIGAGLGYLSGGEEGAAGGAGAGFALGAVGAGLGSITADVTNNRLYDRIAIQRKMVVEGLKGIDDAKASAFEGYVKAAEATGDRRYMAEVDGMIAGIDLVSPNSKWNIRTEAEHKAWLESLKIDPKTGRLVEETAIFPQFGANRKQRASALSFLSMVSDNFSGLPENLLQHIDTLPEDHAMRKHWARLSDDVKQAVLAEVKQSGDIEYRKKFGSKKSNQYYGDINYAEAHTARINSLFDSGNPTQARERINMLLKQETVGGKLTERGKALKDKLATEGYFDKDGNMRPSRLKDVELTENEYKNVAGFVLRKDSTGQVEVNLNINKMGKVTGLHELFHAIMLDSPMKDEFVDRLSTKLLGKFDANGKRIEGASVDTNQIKKFFQRYIDSKYRNDPQERANEVKRLERAIEEYEQRGDQNKVNRTTESTLEHMVEEFGAFYFPKFIQDKPVDYLFRGGELGAMREMFQSVKFGWLDFWRSKIGSVNPEFNADAIQGNKISQAFGKDGQPRYKNKALDLFMSDFVKATAMANRNGNFDLSRLSNEGQKTFIRNNGIRGYGTIDKDGKVVRLNRRSALREEMRVGKEIYKIVAGLDPKLRQGLTLDGEGNFSGRVSPELADALVASGHVDRAWVDKLLRAYDIIDGKESNVIEFGCLCRTAQIGDYAWPRLVGADVPFKNRTAILLDVDFKIGKDGRMSALYHTLDHAVIEGRANAIWSDPAIRSLWDGSRGAMEADFFRYLSNASLPSDHPERVSSAKLLEDGSGKGAMRRNALHQMLGMAKLDGDVYINKPIAEIPLGIRHSVTTFNIDGVSGLRVRQGMRYDYNHRNAFRDLSRNFMMSEMDTESTPNGKILKHGTGYKITKAAGSNRFSVFDVDGKEVGRFDTLADAGRAAQKHYNQTFDAKVEGKDIPVPRTEIPPSRQAYIDREFGGITDNIAGGTEKFLENLNVLLDRLQEGGIVVGEKNIESARRIKKSIEERGNVTLSELNEIAKLGNEHAVIDTKRLPYYDYSYFWELIRNTIDKNYNRLGQQYDNMYPMEIKSALHGRLAQIFQDYPNLTAQGLLKKLDIYGSQGYRYLQEAKEIGLVDLIKSKIKPRTEIYRKMDAQGNFTGEVATREIPVQFRKISVEMKDSEGNVLKDKDGYPLKEFRETTENISGTQPVLDMQEILDFAKSKEIKVTIEEGARELNKMNTERITLGGDKSNYKETAIRINPEYAHGVQGHYGENTIVHFRTTERLDAEGNRVLFIEEVQANNTDDIKRSKTDVNELKESLTILNDFKKNGLDEGILVIQGRGNLETALSDLLDGKQGNNPYLYNKYSESIYNTIVNYLHGGDGYAVGKETIKQSNRIRNSIDDIIYEYHQKGVKITEDELFSRLSDELLEEDYDVINGGIRANRPKAIFDYIEKAIELNDKYVDFVDKYSSKGDNVISSIGTYENITNIAHRLDEVISDLTTGINQATMSERGYPLTSAKDWTLSALKGIIRQAIRDGLDTITLTHPDDSPTVSHMKEGARRGLYGKTIPEVWGSWLRKYGIEIAQQNKLANATIETYRKNLVEVQNKIPEANQAVLDRFQQVMSGEDPANIKVLSELLSTPVHEFTQEKLANLENSIGEIKDQKLQVACIELKQLKRQERTIFGWMEKTRQEGVAGLSQVTKANHALDGGKVFGQSAEAIDRGMTFKLNDAIKRDFLDGNIKTHMMMSEGEDIYAGGRTYNQNSKKWKSGFIGLWAEENPDRLKGYNIEFFQKEAGAYRIRLQDNSVKGRTVDVGHITAVVSGDTATISSKIADEYQGNKLSYALYSEMAERLRAMGIRRVDGQIVNRDGVPIRVRERIIGDTRDYFSGKPIDQIEGAIRIREKQSQFGNMAGVDVYNRLDPNARYMMAEGDALVQNGFEKSELNKQLIASGHIVLGFDERELAGKAVVINNPDTMMTGTLETPSGKILAEGEGGLNFVSKFGDIWANSKEAKAKTTANNLKKAQKENGGVAYLSLTRGSFENALNSHTGAKAGMGILEYFVEQGYISLEEFRNALKDSGRKYGIDFNATQSAKAIHAEIASKFFGVSDSTFERRGDFVKDVITHLAENGESGHKNIEKISNALGANRLGRKIQFAPTGIREAIGLMLSDKRANVDPSHVYAYIEITGNISVEKTENGHKSYPWHIVQRDENGNKIRPRMLIPDKTNYVTDVFLNKNKEEVPRKKGATKLGSNQVGEAYGYVKEASMIPEGKERLKFQPAEGWRDWQSERTSVGSVIKNTAGYVIMVQKGKFKVYNPYKAMVGIYDNEEQAKRRVQKDEPKR